jgi:signal transduction histidine kinase
MILTLLLVVLGQTYWLIRLYDQEFDNLKKGMDAQFRTSFYELQRFRYLKDSTLFSQVIDTVYIEPEKKKKIAPHNGKKTMLMKMEGAYFSDSTAVQKLNAIKPEDIRSIHVVKSNDQPLPPEFFESIILKVADKNTLDSTPSPIKKRIEGMNMDLVNDTTPITDSTLIGSPLAAFAIPEKTKRNVLNSSIIQVSYTNKTLNDSIPLADVKAFFHKSLHPDQQKLTYLVIRDTWKGKRPLAKDPARDTAKGFITSPQLSGFQRTYRYQVFFPDVHKYILAQMSGQIVGSVLMLLILFTAFVFIYHTLHRQKRLADIKNEFISNITHELQTPIATVHVALEALQNFNAIDDPQKTKEYLDISISELNRLELLVDHVLKRTMLEKDSIRLELKKIDLAEIFQNVLITLKVRLEKNNVRIQFDKEGDEFSIIADQLHITSVIYNLLDNAIKYSHENPEIRIGLKKDKNHVVLTVEDKGMGIPEEYKTKIFQPFFRIPNMDRHNVKGYGLGLSYVAQIINLHKGKITVSDAYIKGTKFEIQFPVS